MEEGKDVENCRFPWMMMSRDERRLVILLRYAWARSGPVKQTLLYLCFSILDRKKEPNKQTNKERKKRIPILDRFLESHLRFLEILFHAI